MNFEILHANENHISEILELMQLFNEEQHYKFDKDRIKLTLKEFFTSDSYGKIWIVRIDEKIIGYSVLTFGFSFEYFGKDSFIDEIFIKNEFRKLGIGQKILEEMIVSAKQMGVNAIHLEVETKNNIANEIYENLGFKGNSRKLLTKQL